MDERHVKALGTSSIIPLMLKYSTPSIVATALNATYNAVDRIFVGRTCGEDAIAAITVCFSPTLMLLAVGMTIGVGSATLASIKLGERDRETAEKILGQALFLFIAFCILTGLYMLNFMDQTLTFFGATPKILSDASTYYSIIISGLIFEKISFGINSIVRAEGRPIYAMMTIVIGCIVNVILDYIFLVKWNMGVRGAALATIIAQACGTLWVLYFYAGGASFLKIRLKNLRIFPKIFKSMLGVGSPSFIMQILAGLSVMVLIQQAQIYGGESAITVIGIAMTVSMFLFLPIVGLSMGIQPIVGFNWGAQNYKRVRETFISAAIFATFFCLCSFALVQLFPFYIFALFLGSDSPLIAMGEHTLRIMTMCFPFVALNIITSGFFQSTKRPQISILITTLRQIIFLVPFLIILPKFFGISGVWSSYPLSDFLAFLVTLYFAQKEIRSLSKKLSFL